jgi:hypothetical protein
MQQVAAKIAVKSVSPVYRGVGAKGAVDDASGGIHRFFLRIFFDNFRRSKPLVNRRSI